MTRFFGFVGVLIAVAIGAYIYARQAQSVSTGTGPAASPRMTVDIVGVKDDLLYLANAERGYIALNGKCASIEELEADGDIAKREYKRGPYTYHAECDDTNFRVAASYSGPPNAGVPSEFSVDDTMQISSR